MFNPGVCWNIFSTFQQFWFSITWGRVRVDRERLDSISAFSAWIWDVKIKPCVLFLGLFCMRSALRACRTPPIIKHVESAVASSAEVKSPPLEHRGLSLESLGAHAGFRFMRVITPNRKQRPLYWRITNHTKTERAPAPRFSSPMGPHACDFLMTRSLPKCHPSGSAARPLYVSVRMAQKSMFNLNQTVCMHACIASEVGRRPPVGGGCTLHLPMATLAATSTTSPRWAF